MSAQVSGAVQKPLTTARFTMRPLEQSDTDALYPTLSDAAQCRYLTRAEFTSPEELWGWLSDPDWPGRTWIAEDTDRNVAGRFVASPGHEDNVWEIGYIVCADWQGKGVAGECTRALIVQLWSEGARKLTAEVDPRNTASVRLLETLGFTREAHLRAHDTTHIGVCDVYWYGLLRGEGD